MHGYGKATGKRKPVWFMLYRVSPHSARSFALVRFPPFTLSEVGTVVRFLRPVFLRLLSKLNGQLVKFPLVLASRRNAYHRLDVISPVGVEKVRFPENRLQMGDQKCIRGRRRSFIGHPSATIFRRDLCKRVFQQPLAISQATVQLAGDGQL